MRMKDLANAFANSEENNFIKKIDKELERLIQLRFVAKIVSTVKQIHNNIVPQYLDKNFKCTIEQSIQYPQHWSIIYNVDGNKGKIQIDEADLDILSKGLESIRDNKLLDLASKGIKVENNLGEKLTSMLIGVTLYNEYFQHALETEMAII